MNDDVATALSAVEPIQVTDPALADAVAQHINNRGGASMAVTHIRAIPVTDLDISEQEPNGSRRLTGRLVPYNTVADVVDAKAGGGWDLYREGFRPGAFSPQVLTNSKGVVAKIGLIHRHEGGLGYLGPFTALREEPDGLWGDVAVVPSRADDVAALLRAGVDELSIEFRLPKGEHTLETEGVRWRTRAHLDRVALEPKGAYSTAQVLAYRSEIEDHQRQEAENDTAAQEQQEQEAAAAKRAEAEAEETLARRRRWEELTARVDTARERQEQYVTKFGLTKAGGWGSIRR